MDLNELSPRLIDRRNLARATTDLQSNLERETREYKKTVLGLAALLNDFSRGAVTHINADEARTQTGNLIYFTIKDWPAPIPFDLEFLQLLRSHLRNPTILVLRRIRKFLMPAHRRILARFEEEQARERQIRFRDLDVNKRMRRTLDDMQRYQTMAQLAGTPTRKLDILTKAVQAPSQTLVELKLLEGIFDDKHHLRHGRAMNWLQNSVCRGDLDFLKRIIAKGLQNIQRKSGTIMKDLGDTAGINTDDGQQSLDRSNWYSLTTPLQRGEDFMKLFENSDEFAQASFFPLKPVYDVDWFRTRMEEVVPNPRNPSHYAAHLSGLYLEVERCIEDSSKADGKIRAAIDADLTYAVCNEGEAVEARNWVNRNKIKLQSLLLELFDILCELKRKNPELALPLKLEEMLADHDPEQEATEVNRLIPKIPLDELQKDTDLLQDQEDSPSLLAKLCSIRKKILAWEEFLGEMEFHQQLRKSCSDFDEYESYLLKFNFQQECLEKLRMRCEERLLNCFYALKYRGVPQSLLNQAFDVVVDRMLHLLRKLDYEIIRADRFRELFERSLKLPDEDTFCQLDVLLREIHAIPSQNRLMLVLGEWESSIAKEQFEDKQMFLMENEFMIQEIIDEIRAELRERMQRSNLDSRRLRFDVFSLADSFAGNLRDLLEGLTRLIPTIATEREGEFLLDSVQAIEAQVIEAQRITQPNGEAFRRIRELERADLFSSEFIQTLKQDLEQNFKDLDKLLVDINDALTRIRTQQNRFGANHDLAPFSLTINLRDVEQLKGIYNFVENITMQDIKRFAVVYKHKDAMMESLFKQAYERNPSVPELIRRAINRRVYKAFVTNKNVSIDLKMMILAEVKDILEAESELLLRILNFVAHDKIHKKAMYQAILQILELSHKADQTTMNRLRRIWLRYMEKINNFTPVNYKHNFDNNKRRLIRDAHEIIGDRFEKAKR